MEIATTTEFQLIYPAFVLHKHWEMPEGFNDRLYALAAEDAVANRIREAGDGRNVGDQTNHLGHLRHNFLMDRQDPAIAVLAQMVAAACPGISATGLWLRPSGRDPDDVGHLLAAPRRRENVGINAHTHIQTDIVCTYYPRWCSTRIAPKTSLHRGAVRFYDPANVGKRLWPCRNPDAYVGGWYAVEPRTGSMLVFEGHVPHDSTYFEGEERMCIPVLCSLELPNSHCKAGLSEILAHQAQGGSHGL